MTVSKNNQGNSSAAAVFQNTQGSLHSSVLVPWCFHSCNCCSAAGVALALKACGGLYRCSALECTSREFVSKLNRCWLGIERLRVPGPGGRPKKRDAHPRPSCLAESSTEALIMHSRSRSRHQGSENLRSRNRSTLPVFSRFV